ncbi:hypothetical protein E0493_20115 [Roseomonas sp. M0104]|uniref:Lipoprotein n=1 Tax=Teichococcus coralli TaxID=2545983 RepID=A0A845BQI3_9PROT|nr:hypothetical protein [Pseudoroseomonas coralli]MXP65659.1 hypothetical protein [Pseudoroseomonas coralli]
MHRRAWLGMGWVLGLAACAAQPAAPEAMSPAMPAAAPGRASGQPERDRAAELACIRRGREAEVMQPWLGANNPRAAVIGARVRNDCLEGYRRGAGLPGP